MANTIRLRPKVRPRTVFTLMVVGFAAVVGGHAAFRWNVHRALRSDIQLLREAGERVVPGDFVPREVAPRDNAAPDLTSAAAIVDDESEEACSIDWAPTTLPVNPRAWPYLARATAWFEPALQRVERARQRPLCQWRHNFESPVLSNMSLPELNGVRTLGRLVWAAAMVEHHEGRHDLVVLRFRQSLFLADACEPIPAPIAHVVALSINEGTIERMESLAPTLRIRDGNPEAGDASPEQVRELIAALLDETKADTGFRNSVETQRMYDIDMWSALRGVNPLALYMTRPVVDRNTRRMLNRLTRAVIAVRGTRDWPTAAARLDRIEPLEPIPKRWPVYDSLPFVRRMTQTHFARLTDRRLAATSLAIRLYQRDHAGERPRRLEELVPSYLPSVPTDAMASDGRPLGYRPSPDRPSVYSVGRNGVDDRGDESAMPGEYGEIGAWRRMDRAFYLGEQTRAYIYVPRPDDGAFLEGADVDQPPWERAGTGPAQAETRPYLR